MLALMKDDKVMEVSAMGISIGEQKLRIEAKFVPQYFLSAGKMQQRPPIPLGLLRLHKTSSSGSRRE